MDNTDKPAKDENSSVAGDAAVAPVSEGHARATPESKATSAPESAPERAPEPASKGGRQAVSTRQASPTPSARGGTLGVLSLLVALLALALSGWLFYQSHFAPVATGADPTAGVRAELESSLRQAQQTATGDLRRIEESSAASQAALQRELQALRAGNEERFNSLQATQNSQQQRLLEYTTIDRSDWMLAEAEYLLRLANQRIVMAADTGSAISLLASADSILRELDDPGTHPARAAIADDLAALRAVPKVDVEGTWLRLQAVIGEIDRLVLFERPESQPAAIQATVDTWDQRLAQGFKAALEKMSRFVVITRRAAPYEAMLSPQWEGMVRQNLRMLLEQAQTALLSGNEMLYRASLENARRWLSEFFSLQETGVSALDAEFAQLLQVAVGQDYPTLDNSLSALKTFIGSRHKVEGQ